MTARLRRHSCPAVIGIRPKCGRTQENKGNAIEVLKDGEKCESCPDCGKSVKATMPGSKGVEGKEASKDVLKEVALIEKDDSQVPKSTGVAAASAAGGADVIPVSASRSSAGVVGRATRDIARDWPEALAGMPQASFERPRRLRRHQKEKKRDQKREEDTSKEREARQSPRDVPTSKALALDAEAGSK